MNKKFLAATLLISCTSYAHAGFFDFLFGKEDSAPVAEVKTAETPVQSATPAPETASTMETVTNVAMDLLPTLTKQLGVSDSQAEGGMGSLLQMAQGALSSGEFSELSKSIPGAESLLAAAPSLSTSGGKGGLTSMLSNAGGIASSLGGMAKLTQQFEALGLSPDMIIKFATMAVEYFSSSDSSATDSSETNTGDLLQKGLSAILG